MEPKKSKCMFCDDEMEAKGNPEEFLTYTCPNCRIEYDVYLPAMEERLDYPFFNQSVEDEVENTYHGYGGKCPICGHYVVWSADYMRSEILGECDMDDDDDDSIVGCCTCPHCGSSIEIIYPSQSELHQIVKEVES